MHPGSMDIWFFCFWPTWQNKRFQEDNMTKYVGVLTAGGDTPGLNAALRGLGKSAHGAFDMQLIGFYDGFRGLMQDRTVDLDGAALSGILTTGGTILGTSRDKHDRM